MSTVEFYFDFACARSYLATVRLLESVLRTGSKIIWQPFDLKDLNISSKSTQEPRQSVWDATDLQAWADYCGVQIRASAPGDPAIGEARLGAVYAANQGKAAAYVTAVYAALYGNSDEPVDLAAVAAAAGLDPGEFTAALSDPELARALAANGAKLESRGGFRSATMFVGEQMFCGNSRMPLVEFALGQSSDRQFVMPGQHG
ncbi:MAG: DsbA family protein [Gammaproteobacteria bacterium]